MSESNTGVIFCNKFLHGVCCTTETMDSETDSTGFATDSVDFETNSMGCASDRIS